jgi:hypothetical protein
MILIAAMLLPIAFLSAQHPNPASQFELDRRHAIEINELAGHIDSLEDAQKLVNRVVAEFSDELPPSWKTRSLRKRIALAEYESATNPRALISEQRVANAWNDYLDEVGAPEEYFVTPLEIHYLRDSLYVVSQISWTRGNKNIWTVPNIHAVGSDGKVSGGCRALETIRLLWYLGNDSDSVRGARKMTKGVMFSDMIKNPAAPPSAQEKTEARLVIRAGRSNPIEVAEMQYLRDHGEAALNHAILGLLDNLFPR